MWIVNCLSCLCLQQLLWCFLGGSQYACFSVCPCVFGCRCVHLLFCPAYRADGHNCVVTNMWWLHISVCVCVCVYVYVCLCCVFLRWKEERIWTTGGGQPNSFSLSWPWFPSLASVTAICALSSCSNLRPLLALLNKREDWRQKDPLGPIEPSSSEHLLIDARSSQGPILNVSGGGGGSLWSNTLYTFMVQKLNVGMKIPEPILSAKQWGYTVWACCMETITLVMHVCVYACVRVHESPQGISHKCQCLTVAWVSRVLTPSIPGEHMDAITQSERETEREKL